MAAAAAEADEALGEEGSEADEPPAPPRRCGGGGREEDGRSLMASGGGGVDTAERAALSPLPELACGAAERAVCKEGRVNTAVSPLSCPVVCSLNST